MQFPCAFCRICTASRSAQVGGVVATGILYDLNIAERFSVQDGQAAWSEVRISGISCGGVSVPHHHANQKHGQYARIWSCMRSQIGIFPRRTTQAHLPVRPSGWQHQFHETSGPHVVQCCGLGSRQCLVLDTTDDSDQHRSAKEELRIRARFGIISVSNGRLYNDHIIVIHSKISTYPRSQSRSKFSISKRTQSRLLLLSILYAPANIRSSTQNHIRRNPCSKLAESGKQLMHYAMHESNSMASLGQRQMLLLF